MEPFLSGSDPDAAWQDTWRGSKGSSLGIGSRTSSEDLDSMRSIPQLLRTRGSGAAGAALPELGALLGRGSFGKVYKGARPLLKASDSLG